MAYITLFAQAIGKLPKENIRKIICQAKNRQALQGIQHLANLVVSLRLNTFTKIDLEKWLDEPFNQPLDVDFDEKYCIKDAVGG